MPRTIDKQGEMQGQGKGIARPGRPAGGAIAAGRLQRARAPRRKAPDSRSSGTAGEAATVTVRAERKDPMQREARCHDPVACLVVPLLEGTVRQAAKQARIFTQMQKG